MMTTLRELDQQLTPEERVRRRRVLHNLGVEFVGDLTPEEWEEQAREEAPPTPAPPTLETADPGEIITGFRARLFQKILAELARRKIETPRLYEPLPKQLAFHKSKAPERIVWGSNRSTKTHAALMELVWAASGTHPYLPFPKKNGRYVVVGRDGRHLGEVIWRKLFYPGSYKIIRDRKTGEYRTARPEELQTRKADLVPGPPLLPPRLYDFRAVAWESFKEGIPKKITLHNGSEILFYSGKAAPPQGIDADGIMFDEEIENQNWYPESAMRLLDREGRFWWSATPQLGGDQLADLQARAEEEHEAEEPAVETFHMLLADNPYLSDKQKELAASKLSEDERLVRIYGQSAHSIRLVYPEFSRTHNTCDPFELPSDARYDLFLDPGPWQVVAALVVVTLPNDDHLYLVDEVYEKRCDAERGAEAIRSIVKHRGFQAFWIDHQCGRQTQVYGQNVEDIYARQFHQRGIKSVETGSGFYWGFDDRKAGINRVHECLRTRTHDTSRVRVFRERLPKLEWEFAHYGYKKIHGELTNEPYDRYSHLMDCLRYACNAELRWVKPPVRADVPGSLVVAALKKKRERRRAREHPAGAPQMTFGRAG